MLYKFRVTFFHISLIKSNTLFVIQEVVFIFVDLLYLFSCQFLENFIALFTTSLIMLLFEPFLLGVVSKLKLLTLVLMFSLASTSVSRKERAYFGF